MWTGLCLSSVWILWSMVIPSHPTLLRGLICLMPMGIVSRTVEEIIMSICRMLTPPASKKLPLKEITQLIWQVLTWQMAHRESMFVLVYTYLSYSGKIWWGVNFGGLASLSKGRQFKNSLIFSSWACVSVPVHYVHVYMHEPSLEARLVGRSSPKFAKFSSHLHV